MEDDQGGGSGPSTALKANSSQNLYYTGNSFELAAGASLSDDSGFVPHTNSSISSGGSSSRGIGLCRFEFEMAESDAEVSQFDSLDNFSDGGMSAENYNTLKKGPLAPIEPPPEFQDSPQTTLMRSQSLHNYSFRLTKSIISYAMIDLREMSCIQGDSSLNGRNSIIYFDTTSSSNSTQTTIAKCMNGGCRKLVQKKCRQHMYGSDSFLDQYDTGNIYDEPNSEYYDNHLLYSNVAEANDEAINHNQIYDYDLYYYRKRNFTPVISHKRRRTPSVLFSPLHHHHHHYYHTNSSNSTGNRPNSRNSLTSRLSSSHNSLHVPGSNKADDSIFITQAMSHDALVGRGEISDLYNVPIDSDIYALPVDSVGNNNNSNRPKQGDNYSSSANAAKHRKKCVNGDLRLKPKSRYTRNKRRRRQNLQTSKSNTSNLTATASSSTIANDKRHSVPENRFEPMQMTLDEVKRYYHNLYSSSSESGNEIIGITANINAQVPSSNAAKTKDIDNNCRKTHKSSERTAGLIVAKSSDSILEPLNELIKSPSCNNNNNSNKQSSYTIKTANVPTSTTTAAKRGTKEIKANINNNTITTGATSEPGGKYGISSKKSQFSITFNLRQKFCNIFRFKSRHSSGNNHGSATKNGGDTIYGPQQGSKKQANGTQKVYSEDRRILLSSRALPPLPGTGNVTKNVYTETDFIPCFFLF